MHRKIQHDDNYDSIAPLISDILCAEYEKYIKIYQLKRYKLISYNNYYKSTLHSPKAKKKIIPFIHNIESNEILLNKSIVTCNTTYCYPLTENYISETSYELKYFELFPSLDSFGKSLTKLNSYKHSFHFYPSESNQFDELAHHYFFIWCFIKVVSLPIYFSKRIDSKMCFSLIKAMSQLIRKKTKYVYKVLSRYIINVSNNIQIGKEKALSALNFRKAFCFICCLFYCKIHFEYDIKEKTMTDYNSTTFKVIKRKLVKSSGERQFLINDFGSINNIGDTEKTYKCTGIKKQCCSTISNRNNNNNNTNQSPIKFLSDIIDLIPKEYFYVLNCILSTDLFNNPCFFNRLFNYKFSCRALQEIILFCNEGQNYNKINAYLGNSQMEGQYPEIARETLYLNRTSINALNKPDLIIAIDHSVDYIPCNHIGICKKEKCHCKKRGACEKFCCCSNLHCELQFEGCKCFDGCKTFSYNKAFSNCPCRKQERECDPDICTNCRNCKNCTNMKIYYNKEKQTVVGQSLIIPGLGLFAWEDIKAHDLIAEYKGEIIKKDVTELRSTINELLERNYLFGITDKYDIDSIRCGNRSRYINHSNYGYENCYAANIFVRGVNRIALFAKRDIKKGEELYFDYQMKELPWINEYNVKYKPIEKHLAKF